MFAAWCDTHETEVLLSERRIFDIEMKPETAVVRFICWCGTEGSFEDPRVTTRSAAEPSGPDLAGPAHHVLGRRQLA